MLPVTITPNSINILFEGRMRTVNKTHINFEAVKAQLRTLNEPKVFGTEHKFAMDKLRDLLDIPSFIARVTEGRVKVGDNAVFFDGEEVKGIIAQRLLEILKNGLDVRPLARFLDRLRNNPDFEKNVQDEVYLFLESGQIPITPDGCFLAFKKVGGDYASSHPLPDGSKLYNRVGDVVAMNREEVDRDRYNTCSRGLHFCSWQYLPQFGMGGEAKVVIVKIAPEDVVSIPNDYNNSKGRAWRYVVVDEVPEDECRHLFDGRPVVSSQGLYDGSEDGYDEGDDCGCDVVGCMGDPDYDENLGPIEEACSDCGGLDEHRDDCDLADEEDAKPETIFKIGRRKWTGAQLIEAVADLGQRGFARKYDIPRTTLQGWLATARQEE
jgi:hypothetical protein